MTLPPLNHAKRGRDTRLRSARHLAFVRKHLCALWARQDCEGKIDAAHLRDLCPEHGMGVKPSDNWTVSLCRKHHRESEGREEFFERDYDISLLTLAMEYAAASPDPAIREAVRLYRSNLKPKGESDARTVGAAP